MAVSTPHAPGPDDAPARPRAPLSPASLAVIRCAARTALERYDEELAIAIATDAQDPARSDRFNRLVAAPSYDLLAGLVFVPEPERDGAVGALIVALFSELLNRDITQARRRAEVDW